jgi:hypothetical protein
MRDAACAETGDVGFLPERGQSIESIAACKRSLVREECVAYVLTHRIGARVGRCERNVSPPGRKVRVAGATPDSVGLNSQTFLAHPPLL